MAERRITGMPKFRGENEKVTAARERKAAHAAGKAAVAAAAKEEADAAAWAVGSNAKGLDRRKEREDKAAAKLAHKQELRAAAEEDMAETVKGAKKKGPRKKGKGGGMPDELLAAMEGAAKKKGGKMAKSKVPKPAPRQGGGIAPKAPRMSTMDVVSEAAAAPRGKTTITEQTDIFAFENRNRALGEEGASGIEAGIDQLALVGAGGGAAVDRHPERRMKAAYKAWEERELPRIRAEQPGMKLSQYKERLFSEWKKSPENPMNMEHGSYNDKRG